jgi:hypothetical protein
MRSWYSRIVRDSEAVLGAIDYFEAQYLDAITEIQNLKGQRLLDVQSNLPGIVGFRYEQLTEMESIMEYLEIREAAVVGEQRRHYVEHYNRALTDRMVEKFAESHPDVIALREVRNHVAAVRNKFVALSKQHEYLHYQLLSIVKLRVAGLDEAIL